MMRPALAAAIGTLVLASACGGSPSASKAGDTTQATLLVKPGATVHLVFTEFKPTDYSISAGQALTFVNDNPITHTIVEGSWTADKSSGLRTAEKDDGVFRVDVSRTGQSASQVYDKPGTYQFFCTIHKGMNGTVTVR